jgi:molecular chaperone DnaK (HSP70)
MILSIDFGTTNTVVARWDVGRGAAEVLALPGLGLECQNGSPSLVPSLLYVRDGRTGQTAAGEIVRREGLDRQRNNRLFRNFKRGVVMLNAVSPRIIDDTAWDDRDAAQVFLRQLLAALPCDPGAIDQLVLTAPVAAFENYVGWLSKSMTAIPAEKIRVVDESTAAALGYAVTTPGAPVLVMDFGGGTLDLSLVQLPEKREKVGGLLGVLRQGSAAEHSARVIAKAGYTLGGSDIDRWLLEDVLQRTGVMLDELGDGYAALLTDCEQAKIALSSSKTATITFEAGGKSHSLDLTRVNLESLMKAHGFFSTLRHGLDSLMHIAQRGSVFREDVAYVLIVGGTSLMPSVLRTLKQYFRGARILADKPFTAVAEGALQAAAGMSLDDYLVHSYGLRHLNPDTGQHEYEEIIPQGSRYPTHAPFEVLIGAAHPDQESIEFVIGMINTDAATRIEVRYEDGQPVFVASDDQPQVIALNESAPSVIVPLKPKGKPGKDRIKAAFRVDEARQLRVTVTDLKTRKELLRDTVIVTLR